MLRIYLLASALALGTAASPPTTYIAPQKPGAAIVARMEAPRPNPNGYTAAPVPNVDLDAPIPANPAANQASLSPNLYTTHTGYHGEGFIAGSTSQAEQQKKFKPTPGVALSVPLE